MKELNDESLNIETFRKLISKETNDLLNDVIENISCCADNHSLLGISREILGYIDNGYEDFNKLIEQISNDLKDYSDVVCEDYNDLTNKGYDFLLLFIQYDIEKTDWEEFAEAVGF